MFAGVYAGKRCTVDTMMQQVCMLQWVLPKNRMSGAHSTTFLGQGSQNEAAPEEEGEFGEGGGEGEGEVVEDQGSGSVVVYIFWNYRLAFEDDGCSQSTGDMLPVFSDRIEKPDETCVWYVCYIHTD